MKFAGKLNSVSFTFIIFFFGLVELSFLIGDRFAFFGLRISLIFDGDFGIYVPFFFFDGELDNLFIGEDSKAIMGDSSTEASKWLWSLMDWASISITPESVLGFTGLSHSYIWRRLSFSFVGLAT